MTHGTRNEYSYLAAQVGMMALAILVFMLWPQWTIAGKQVTSCERTPMRALPPNLATDSLLNPMMLDHIEGISYAWLSGLQNKSLNCDLPASYT